MESFAILVSSNVSLISVSEQVDWSTPEGAFLGQNLGSVSELFSKILSRHVKKGVDGRVNEGRHLGSLAFGYQSCYEQGLLKCDEEHPGGVHVVTDEAGAAKELFRRYASGGVTLAQLATWMNSQGLRTRNTKNLPDGSGATSSGPKLFTTASVRGILHRPFYAGRVRHQDELLPGAHEALVGEEVFQAVQVAMKRNSGRSETLHPRPEREYVLKGLIKCAYCGMSLWAQTLKSGSRLYREQHRSRSHTDCRADGKSIACNVPDEQMGRIVSAIVLPDAWMDRVLAQIQLADEVKRVAQERKETEQRLKRLGQVYLDGVMSEGEYQRQKRLLHDRLASLVVPGVDAAKEAGRLLDDLPKLWDGADLSERRKLLLTMLDAVYVETVEERTIVAILPKPAFLPLFEVATTREGSNVILFSEREVPPANGPEAADPCLWWRRGRVELPVQKIPRWNVLQACSALCYRYLRASADGIPKKLSDLS